MSNKLSFFHASAATGSHPHIRSAMAALIGEQLTLMLKTINDAGNANATAIATLYQSTETLRSQSMMAERAWQVTHEELHARIHKMQSEAQQPSSAPPYRRSSFQMPSVESPRFNHGAIGLTD